MSFELATRRKLKFSTTKGMLSIEDLWDLSLEVLNNMLKNIKRSIKVSSEEEDYLDTKTVSIEDSDNQLRFDVLKHILDTKKNERDQRTVAAAAKIEYEKILAQLARREEDKLNTMSEEELRKRLAELAPKRG